MNLEELKKKIKERIDNIKFHPHFYDSLRKRPYLSKGLVVGNLKKYEKYEGFQEEEIKGVVRYRLGINLSRKYTLVVIAEIHEEHLNIVSAWNTDRKWQKATQK